MRLGLSIALAALAAGCGSTAPAELPPPATPVHSPPSAVAETPGFGVSEPELIMPLRVDGRRDRVVLNGRSAPTCREPVDVASLDRERLIAVLCGRERVVQLFDAAALKRVGEAPAGTGPARLATDGHELLYVTDVVGESLLVYHLRPSFELIRRVNLPGGPFGIAHDPARSALWITLTAQNRVVEYADGSRPVRVGSFATVRQPNRVDVVGRQVWIDRRQMLEAGPGRARPRP